MFNVVVKGVERATDYIHGVLWRFRRSPQEIGARIASTYLNILQANCPVVTGATRERIAVETQADTEGHYWCTVSLPFYLFVRPGTVITPKRAKALRFYWDRVGAVVFFSRVVHPGVGGGPDWIYHALDEAESRIPTVLRQELMVVIEHV